jgi:hypothetical protein
VTGREVPPALAELLDDDERNVLVRRAKALVKAATFPNDPGGRSYPWPLV